MSEEAVSLNYSAPTVEPARAVKSFVSHAKLIGSLTFISRLLGMARESVAANYFGAGAVWSAFTVAFTIPNLFRKLFGEGALSAAFIPLYAQAVRQEGSGFRIQDSESPADSSPNPEPRTPNHDSSSPNPEPRTLNPQANAFAAASVNLLCAILIVLTLIGEAILLALGLWVDLRSDQLLAVKLTAIMLPYVLLVCGAAFLGAILQVHKRFAAVAAVPILLNLCLIIAIVAAAKLFDLDTLAGQQRGVMWLSVAVLVAGTLQILMLLPSLRAAGFRFQAVLHVFTPQVKRMITLTIPVALGAGVLQIGVMLDKAIALLLAQAGEQTHFELFGNLIRYPMVEGAAARLNWAQFMYQFPLGVFAIALATAIFPRLSDDALDTDRSQFKSVLRRGIEASLFIGLPASIGMIVVRYPAVELLFERGNFTPADTIWVARSTALYSAAIWAFSLQQILNRAYYALHDTTTPFIWAIVNLLMNLVIELPLIWTGLGEAGMAVGTLVSFAVQSLVMLWMLDRRLGGMGLRQIAGPVLKMLVASGAMWAACATIQYLPFYPHGDGKFARAIQLLALIGTGGLVYFGSCAAMGMNVLGHLRRNPQ